MMKYYEHNELKRIAERLSEHADKLAGLTTTQLAGLLHFRTVGAVKELAGQIVSVVVQAEARKASGRKRKGQD